MSDEEDNDNYGEYDEEEDDDNLEERPAAGKRKGKKLRDQTHKKRKSGRDEKRGAKNLYFENGAEESDGGEEDSDLDFEQRQLNREKNEALYRTRKAPQF